MARRMMLAAALMAGLAGIAAPAWAQADAQPAGEARPGPRIAPEAQRVLDRVREHYASVKSVSVLMAAQVGAEGEVAMEPTLSIVLERPNRALLSTEEGKSVVCSDGTTLWQYMGHPLDKYSEEPAPATFRDILSAVSMGEPLAPWMSFTAPHALVMSLMDETGLETIVSAAEKVEYVGQETINLRPVDRLRFTYENISADLWIRAEGKAWIDRITPDPSRMFPAEMKMDSPMISFSMKHWTSRDAAPEGTFTFKPPEGAEKVKSLAEAMERQQAEGNTGEGSPMSLVGKPAPAISLPLLGGGTMDLESHKGKNVVVLDFWATWCSPCVRALPVLSEVTGSFKDRGVVFYAVNQMEAEGIVRKFLDAKELKLKVPMDTKGTAAEAFKVSGIPQTVLIGKDGTVQAVHVGFGPGMERKLREELARLVEGKPLAGADDGEERERKPGE